MYRFLAVLCLFAPAAAAQSIHIVDASGFGDYTQIQPAIDASQSGDLILVRATGDYQGFVLNKGALIRAESNPFRVRNDEVTVTGIPGDEVAGISGMILWFHPDTGPFLQDALLDVAGSDAEIILENLELSIDAGVSMRIQDASNVSVHGLNILPYFPFGEPPVPAALEIVNSRVSLTEATIEGGIGGVTECEDGGRGGDGVLIVDSLVELASPRIIGGKGGFAYVDCGCNDRIGGRGGRGLVARNSEVLILGTEIHFIQGGKGGEVVSFDIRCDRTCDGTSGPGGHGLVHESGATVDVSRAQLIGGEPGDCFQDEHGDPVRGDASFQREDILPFLSATPNFALGLLRQLQLDATEAGTVLILYSDAGGFINFPNVHGPTLNAVPGTFFEFLKAGRTDAAGQLQLTFTLPAIPELIGFPLHFQAFQAGDSGERYLSNSVVRIVGP